MLTTAAVGPQKEIAGSTTSATDVLFLVITKLLMLTKMVKVSKIVRVTNMVVMTKMKLMPSTDDTWRLPGKPGEAGLSSEGERETAELEVEGDHIEVIADEVIGVIADIGDDVVGDNTGV